MLFHYFHIHHPTIRTVYSPHLVPNLPYSLELAYPLEQVIFYLRESYHNLPGPQTLSLRIILYSSLSLYFSCWAITKSWRFYLLKAYQTYPLRLPFMSACPLRRVTEYMTLWESGQKNSQKSRAVLCFHPSSKPS